MSTEQMASGNKFSGKEENHKKNRYKILTVLFLVGFCISMIFVVRNYIVEQRAKAQFEHLADNVISTEQIKNEPEELPTETETETESPDVLAERGITIPELDLNWKELYETNEDIYSWIYIPDTKINYPVLQDAEKMNYYLDHNLDHSTGLPGCIYTQLLNKKDYTDNNTVLYGHNMKNGTMFKGLHQYSDAVFFAEHRYIYVYTPEKVLVYEIYGACEVSDAHLLYKYNFDTEEGVPDFLEDIKTARSMSKQVAENMEIQEGAKLITLSTCIGNKPNNRWVVVGVLLGEQMIEE